MERFANELQIKVLSIFYILGDKRFSGWQPKNSIISLRVYFRLLRSAVFSPLSEVQHPFSSVVVMEYIFLESCLEAEGIQNTL